MKLRRRHAVLPTVLAVDSKFAPEGSICQAGSPGRLTETEQRRYATAYINSFFRLQLAGERKLAPMWTGATAPAGAVVQVTRIPGVSDRLVINPAGRS
jgi:hypothetical protein